MPKAFRYYFYNVRMFPVCEIIPDTAQPSVGQGIMEREPFKHTVLGIVFLGVISSLVAAVIWKVSNSAAVVPQELPGQSAVIPPRSAQGTASGRPAVNPVGVPQITSVSTVLPKQSQPITVSGNGFGEMAAYTGNSDYIRVSDLTKGWNAGWTKDPGTDKVTLMIKSWTDTAIVIDGFGGDYGNGWNAISPGDQLEFRVWNAHTDYGPSIFTAIVAQVRSGTEDAHPDTPIRETYQRVFSGDFLFELQSCVLRGTNLTCDFTMTNDLSSDRTLGLLIYWGPCSRLFDDEGNEYISNSGQLGNQSGTPGISGFGDTLISGVKTKAALEFEGIPPGVKTVKLLRVMFDSPFGRMNHLNADFRDVPVQAR